MGAASRRVKRARPRDAVSRRDGAALAPPAPKRPPLGRRAIHGVRSFRGAPNPLTAMKPSDPIQRSRRRRRARSRMRTARAHDGGHPENPPDDDRHPLTDADRDALRIVAAGSGDPAESEDLYEARKPNPESAPRLGPYETSYRISLGYDEEVGPSPG